MTNATESLPVHSCVTGRSGRKAALLDLITDALLDRPTDMLNLLFLWLHAKRRELLPPQWQTFIQECRQHPLLQRLHADPLTYRAYAKLRGYAGDAPLLDLIYSADDADLEPNDLTEEARAIFQFTRSSPASKAVRSRRQHIADLVDRTAARTAKPRILSIAAGHLREAALSKACAAGQLGEWMALDQDRQSLSAIMNEYGHLGVSAEYGTVRTVLKQQRRDTARGFDLVYASGLFDYLEQPVAQRLVDAMFHLLNPGGTLLATNFVPDIPDVGYMECVMDWHLIYRTPEEMLDLAVNLPHEERAETRLSSETDRNLVFLQITRADTSSSMNVSSGIATTDSLDPMYKVVATSGGK